MCICKYMSDLVGIQGICIRTWENVVFAPPVQINARVWRIVHPIYRLYTQPISSSSCECNYTECGANDSRNSRHEKNRRADFLGARFCLPRYYHKSRRSLLDRKIFFNNSNPSWSDFNRSLSNVKSRDHLYYTHISIINLTLLA